MLENGPTANLLAPLVSGPRVQSLRKIELHSGAVVFLVLLLWC